MSTIVLLIYRIASFLKRVHVPLVPRLVCTLLIRIPFGCHLGLGIHFGRHVCLAYGGLGTVIHYNAVIGDNVYIGPGVTIGSTNRDPRVAHVEDNCLISTGARLIGPVTIGEGSVIGANAVVVDSVPAHALAVGIPARVIKTDINIAEYR